MRESNTRPRSQHCTAAWILGRNGRAQPLQHPGSQGLPDLAIVANHGRISMLPS
nr:MAG TPA: hypothetical protein [Caudoviricetes sp.]